MKTVQIDSNQKTLIQYIIGIFIAFFLAVLILTKKGRTRADRILGIWMIVVGIHLLTFYSFITQTVYQYPHFLGINIPIPFLHGVFLYLYVESLTIPDNFNSKKWMLHFILPIFIVFINLPFYMLPSAEKLAVFKNNGKDYEGVMRIDSILLTISGILYVVITHRLLLKHKKSILNQFSNQEKINLNWLRLLTYMMVVMWVLIIFFKNDMAIFTAASIFVILLGYFGIKQVGIFTNHNTQVVEEKSIKEEIVRIEESNTEKKKYAKSGLNKNVAMDIHRRLTLLMQNEKLFIESDLTLVDLALRLEIHPNYLSQVINEIERKNFYDYINELRIEEFKRLVAISENQKYTILALAYDCGFNSKSSFNRFFKKATDMSPSEYVSQISKL